MERKRGSESLFGSSSQWDRTKLGLGLGWSRKGSETEIFVDTMRSNKPALGGIEPDSQRELTAEFTQTFYGDNWSVSAYGSLSDQRSRFSADKFFAAGASFSISGKKLPKLSFSVDLNKFGLRMRDADFGPEDYLLSERQLRVSATIDLTKFLPEAAKDQKKPLLKVKAYGDWPVSDESFEGTERRVRPTLMVVYGKTF